MLQEQIYSSSDNLFFCQVGKRLATNFIKSGDESSDNIYDPPLLLLLYIGRPLSFNSQLVLYGLDNL